MVHRPDLRHFVHQLGGVGEVFSHANAGEGRFNAAEFTTNISGGVRLEIPHVLLRRTSREVQDDAVLGGTKTFGA